MDKSQIIALALNILNTNSCVSDFGIHIPKMKPCNLCEQELITQPDGLIKEFTMISEVKLPWMWTLMYYLRSNELEMLDEEVQILGQKKRSREVNRGNETDASLASTASTEKSSCKKAKKTGGKKESDKLKKFIEE
ncbi:hypothetical protein GLOIN_2v1488298 [Rhizophagus irregularis DAOM 181602=DAOM 197198]|uniref:Uncharacterized protein n=1 Tax=Rhizophagus irregularis (strain DAOM 181602 / DAOM 197198 / MUCL 43194) TaxID=747089 RepID=A0A2P4P0A0_RHIID|nr:hypothetical protein GLOIN_2v1488298 [Rhizophagus irregularis DAOM 181602=DAOM 197198]POG58829.1 hypothetical protein GLOIN_2v1488298 [Rhizophagus irregularis DAOM 181602=DAOM 197198]|eukprot:XP_025165695.1 hypothetical protein GLOIN_2v1488298 [Rhizophagus irregularis DAOM 181602=DAOM 197198]